MEATTGLCTKCGNIVNLPHTCSDALARLAAIDKEAGCGRTVREILIADGKKGYQDKIETLELEAIELRKQL